MMTSTSAQPSSGSGPSKSACQTDQHDRLVALAGIGAALVAALAVLGPFFLLGNASGHDIEFHLASWMDVVQQWHAGVAYPRWAVWANYGFGEPRFIFYPPASWLLGAGLGWLLPWKMAAGAFIWLSLVLAGISMVPLAREWLGLRERVAAAVLYAVNPYHLLLVYYRSDFAELLASALFPLLVWLAMRIGQRGWPAVAPLAVVFSAIWLCNAPMAVVATYSLVLLIVVVATRRRSGKVLACGAATLTLGFSLAAIYIVPAVWEQAWVNIKEALTSGLRPEQNFLFSQANDPEFNLFNLKVSTLAAVEIVILSITALVADRRKQREKGVWWDLTALAAASLILMFPVSKPAWELLPKLRFVQFPWRWLVPLNVALALFVAAAISRARRKWAWWLLTGAALVALAGAMVSDAWWDTQNAPVLYAAIFHGHGYEGTDEYAPLGCDHYDLPQAAPEVALARNDKGEETSTPPPVGGRQIQVERWAPERKIIMVDATESVVLALRLVNYPAWRVEVNGKQSQPESAQGTARMLVRVPAGHSRVEVRFARTLDRTLGAALSIAAVAVLLIISQGHP